MQTDITNTVAEPNRTTLSFPIKVNCVKSQLIFKMRLDIIFIQSFTIINHV